MAQGQGREEEGSKRAEHTYARGSDSAETREPSHAGQLAEEGGNEGCKCSAEGLDLREGSTSGTDFHPQSSI